MPDPLAPTAELLRAARRDPALRPRLDAAVDRLTPAYRDALTLHLDHELPLEQVARMTRLSVASAQRRVDRAEAYVRRALATAR